MIFQKFLMHIIFGEDIDSTIMVSIETLDEACGKYHFKDYSLSQAIEETFEQVLDALPKRLPNPIWNSLYFTTGKCFSFTKSERVSDSNCIIVRNAIRSYVRKRVSGELKSTVANNSDLLSLLLLNPEVFAEEDVIDELMDLLIGGTHTTQMTT
mmetsp:Transcript_417/g.551  ORF Transcript_417/g.551 Transcript_417/m.551 type:complete len:154 (+) Transcript_417:442-903(+)